MKAEIKNRLSEHHVKLIRDEAVTITLFALSHLKVKQAQDDALKSVHQYLASWANSDESLKIAQDILTNNLILQHGLILLRNTIKHGTNKMARVNHTRPKQHP